MTACREFGPGEMIRCPGPYTARPGYTAPRSVCDAPLQRVGAGSRARVCVGDLRDDPAQHTVIKCKACGSQVRIEVWRLDEQGVA